ncbi:hypothetical protein ACLB2K_002369 [Fragaria x ananassa]
MESKWITFYNEKSEKMKIIRGKQLHPHTLSRKGYARYEYDWNTNNPGKRLYKTVIYPWPRAEEEDQKCSDGCHNVLGKEKSGRVRGMGAGVTPSRVDAQIQSASWKNSLEEKLEANCMRAYKASRQSGTGGGDPNSGSGSKRISNPANTSQEGPENGEVGIHSSPQIETSKSVQESTFCVNDLCEVLDWEGTGLVVARGKISAVDPTTKVHGYNLGHDCYRVVVEEAVVLRAEFYRPQPEFSTMEDAVGSTIAWPTKYIVPL